MSIPIELIDQNPRWRKPEEILGRREHHNLTLDLVAEYETAGQESL